MVSSRIMIYTYASIFHINPLDAYNTPYPLIVEMLGIHNEVKKIQAEEMEKEARRSR